MISIIVAVACNGVIGGGNSLLWHITEDLKRFRAITTGHPVIMGRKTYQSIGKPLPGRHNIIITRNKDFEAPGCTVADSLENAIRAANAGQVFIIGGGEIYRQALPMADKLYITEVCAEYEGDTFFPEIDPGQWEVVFREEHSGGEKFPHPFRFIDYERRVRVED